MSARFYNPGIGAFTQFDSVLGQAQNPISMHRFLYAAANPATLTDPTGHQACSAMADVCSTSTGGQQVNQHARADTDYRRALDRRQRLAERRSHIASGRPKTFRRVSADTEGTDLVAGVVRGACNATICGIEEAIAGAQKDPIGTGFCLAASILCALPGNLHRADVLLTGSWENKAEVATELGVTVALVKLPSVLPAKGAKAPSTASPWSFARTEALSGSRSAGLVEDLAASMKDGGWQGAPIKVVEVDGRMIVVDGHHRLAATKRVGIDVPYDVVDPGTVIRPGQWNSLADIVNDSFNVGPDRLGR